MPEQLVNNAASTLSAGIDNLVTSLTVANGTVFPASGNFRIIIDSEIIIVGARSGNTLSSLTRGAETTAASAHLNGAPVTHVLTKVGLDTYLQDTLGQWQAYTPVWTSSGTAPSLGNGAISGRYARIGKTVFFIVSLTMGSTTTYGTGTYALTLPVTAFAAALLPIGVSRAVDISAGSAYHGVINRGSTTTLFGIQPSAADVAYTNTVPFTWATNDIWVLSGTYEAA